MQQPKTWNAGKNAAQDTILKRGAVFDILEEFKAGWDRLKDRYTRPYIRPENSVYILDNQLLDTERRMTSSQDA